jgi:hypothetical protein
MTMGPRLRKLMLTIHLVVSVGWIGAVIAYLALDVAAVTDPGSETSRAAWAAMQLTAETVLVPLAVASLVTGLVMALGTPWGLLRHYWVVISFVLTTFAASVLILHMSDLSAMAQSGRSAEGHASGSGAHASAGAAARGDFLHAGGGLVVLLAVAVLNVYKPRGLTPYGWRQRFRAPDDRGGGAPQA